VLRALNGGGAERGGRVQFRILGPLEVLNDHGRPLVLGGAKQRALLAVLLLHAGQVVSADRLIDELWGEDPPETARSVLQVYVANLRKVLEPARSKRTASSLLKTQPPGYLLDLDGHALDLDRFEVIVGEGRAALAAGQASEAASLLGGALGLWRGPGLGDVALLGRGQGAVAQLEERRLAALEDRIEADLALARHRELVGELETLVAEHPLRERLWGQLMLALYRSGRQADALAAFQRARDKLVEELGIEPGAELRELEARVLAQDPRLAAPHPPLPELPAPLAEVGPTFVGRAEELAWLQAGLERAVAGRGVLRLVEGPPEAGKTRLAAELTRLAQDRHIPIRYAAGPAIAAELAAAHAVRAGPARVALLVLDDLHAAETLPLEAIQRLVDTGRPVLVVGTYDPDAVSSVQRAALEQLVLAGAAERRSLPALAAGDVAEIIRRYAADADDAEVNALADRLTDATPGQVHQAASAWAMQRAAGRVDTAVAQLPEPQRVAQDAREELVAGVLELQHIRTQRTAEEPAQAHRLPVCPYKGLAAYGPDDAAYFVGRERLIAETLAHLVDTELLAVVGPSGSGKSSLVRAGLLPALAAGTLPGSQRWQQLLLTPGDRPAEALDRALADLPSEGRTLLVVDQLEELFTLAVADQRQAFVDRLVEALRSPYADVVAVVTLRSDYYGHCADYPDLAKLVQATTVLVGAMHPEELHRAIEVPAELAGLEVEPGVTEAILADAADQPGALPLVSTALLALWEHRAGRRLTLAGYAQTGGVRGAIARLADGVYDGFDPHQQAIARAILLRLTEPGEGGNEMRRRARRSELGDDEATTKVLSTLVARRLLIADDQTVEVAHEALLREWPRLRGWLEEDRQGRRLHHQLTEAANQWAAHDRDPEQLYRGARLAAALDWARGHDPDLNDSERAFLTASTQQHERQLRRARRTTAVLASLLVVVLVAGALALVQRSTARRNQVIAAARGLAAQATARTGSQSDLAFLLAVEASRSQDSVETRGGLLTVLGQSARLTGFKQGFGSDLYAFGLAPDGSTVAAGSRDGTLQFGDLGAGTPRTAPIKAHGGLFGLTFSRDGRLLVTAGEDGTARLWNVARAAPVGNPLKHQDAVRAAGFSPDDKRLYTLSDGGLRAWAVPAGTPIAIPRFSLGDLPPASLAVSPNGGQLAVGTAFGPVWLLDAKTGRRRHTLTSGAGRVNAVAFSPDGTQLATGSGEGDVYLWDPASGRQRGRPIAGHDDVVSTLGFSPDGQTLASGGIDGKILLREVGSGERTIGPSGVVENMGSGRQLSPPLVGHAGVINHIAFTGQRRLVSASSTEVATWDLDSAAFGHTLGDGPAPFYDLALSPDDRKLAAVEFDRVRLFDLASRRQIGQPVTTPAGQRPGVATFSPDGRLVAASAAGSEQTSAGEPVGPWEIRLIEAETARQIGRLPTDSPVIAALAFSPDGRLLAADNGDGRLSIWNLAERRRQGNPLPVDPVPESLEAVAFSPDGRTLAAGSGDGTVILFDPASGKRLGEPLAGHVAEVESLAYSPDGALLASSSPDGTVIVRDAHSRRPIGEPLAPGIGPIARIAFSRDGAVLAAAGRSGPIALWDVQTRQLIGRPLAAHSTGAWGVALPDRDTLASAGEDGLVIWNLHPTVLVERACALAGRNLTKAEWDQFLGGDYRRTCPQWPQG
jgi:WD40 repeat protein/DNA-binding SARP family transcriptional activator